MSRVCIDTNAYTALMAGDHRIADVLSSSEAVILPTVVIGELLDGFLNGTRNQENRQILSHFQARPRTVTVPLTEATAEWFAEIKRGLRLRGRPIPINDVWIAASCMEHGAILLTLDSHFEAVDGLRRHPLPDAT
ncbi:MAG TPA: type II toxin-antitoxin system VapC family toxin [Alkalispirochaeta sp.]|nr:type II toxin-antitoxin system VapC family toxin [Alkalispirochaeta sp.]